MSATTALTWFKSSYSGDEGGACLEVAIAWQKSTYSDGEYAACVEVANCATQVHVRDSKVPHGPVLDLTPAAWATLTEWTAR
ncbi:DUF397 domain-containing protein [Streptomyces sp. NPDC002812]|uniref:DUF397 domain-containing protein n=1 Tax=unclassified Streptomyces TaxID=2593676 RepID=UPI00224FA128|nr:DUF397 domain-containing protein [Streptomyces sp. NBC_00347]MCX5123352.1 DUF397 domain-containing protein [Streptomyces sp. NBC_00347]